MALPDELVSQLVKIVGARGSGNTDYSVYGTIVESGGQQYVRFDGSDINTPFESTVEVSDKDRVIVEVKGHTATVTGNTSHPSLGKKTADGFQSLIEQNANSIKFAVEEIGKTKASIELLPASIKSTVKSEYFDPLNATINGENGISARLTTAESTISQMPEAITSTVKATLIDPINGEVTKFSEFKQKFDSFEFITEGGKVKIGSGNLQLTGAISFSDLKDYSTVNSKISNAASDAADAVSDASSALSKAKSAASDASSALSKANSTDSTLTKLLSTSDTTTYIDGTKILTDSIYANKMHLGGWMKVYKTEKGDTAGGWIGYSSGFNSTSGIAIMSGANASTGTSSEGQCVCTDLAARLSYGSNPQLIVSKNKSIVAEGSSVKIVADGAASKTDNGDTGYISLQAKTCVHFRVASEYLLALVNSSGTKTFRPDTTITDTSSKISTLHLGHSNYKFKSLFVDAVSANTCSGTTSDKNEKNSIEDLPEKYIKLFDNLRPVRYKLNSGSSGRYHIGYIAQEVEEVMNDVGIDSQEFGGFIKDQYEDGSEYYMLRYGEFDGIRDAKIKQLEARLAAIEERI